MKHPTLTALLLGGVAGALTASAQNQSLAFTGGVLLNTRITFHGLGGHPAGTDPGPATGATVIRNYDDGFNGVDETGNAGATTSAWGYESAAQVQGDSIVFSSASAEGGLDSGDRADFIGLSGNLEYRGSLGPVGRSDWGVLLGVGYQSVSADYSGSFTTDAQVLEDAFGLAGTPAGSLPEAPYTGSGATDGVRIASSPMRTIRTAAGGRALSGTWEFDANLVPITGGVYLESQLMGRLNGIVSAGLMGLFVDADFTVRESSTIGAEAPLVTQGQSGTSEILLGAFVQLGVDFALWEKASLVASARWQPAESFGHSVSGREAEVDFITAFAVHTGLSFRF